MELTTIFLFMVFCHILDDFVLQAPCLCNLKQKSFWRKNISETNYKYDYIVALIMHAFSWSFMIMVPCLIFNTFNPIVFLVNVAIHAFVDDLKANKGKINLIIDQTIHLFQIFITWIICFNI
jgi:hypothetical protein